MGTDVTSDERRRQTDQTQTRARATTDASSDDQGQVDQPGLREVREAVVNYAARQMPERPRLRRDGLAGLNSALTSVPDGMASGILAGVNPVYGLYACTAGPIAGGLFSSTQRMIIVTTSASALAAGQALATVSPDARDNALFILVVLIGAFQIVFGLLRAGRLTRFVSYSVMIGFVAGIAILTVLSQLPTVTGYASNADNRISATIDLLQNPDRVNLQSLGVALLAVILAIALPRTRLGNLGNLVAIAAPSLVVTLMGWTSVEVVADVGEIPRGLPLPAIPDFSGLTLELLTGGFALAVIILVQGTGVSQSVPNRDGSRRRVSRDFFAQGMANVASGLAHGLPVGGSLSTTAVGVASGARTRWAAILTGVWMAVILTVASDLVSGVAMPSLGALLIVASVRTIKPVDIDALWNAGWPSVVASATTFMSTLVLPIQAAVGIGVTLSALMYVYRSSSDITVVQIVERPDGRLEERRPPRWAAGNTVTVLDVYGNLFYAGARTIERLLPRPTDGKHPVVILRLRGRADFGATLVDVLSSYAHKLDAVDGRLYLTGISQGAYKQVDNSGKLHLTGPVRAY